MKFVFARIARASCRLAAIVLAAAPGCLLAQNTSAPQQDQSPQPRGQVIFSRSTDQNGQMTEGGGPITPEFAGQPVTAPVATDAERRAVTFTALDLDVHLHPANQKIAVRAIFTVRNDSKFPLAHIPLQISSSLQWEHIVLDGHGVPFTIATLNSDVDHTGQLHEAAIALPHPLAPGAKLQFLAYYSGVIEQSAKRLLAIGTPQDVALHSDWDQIGVDFTGLRGFGNVVWYPVSSVPVILGDGNRVFDELGEHKLRISGARFSIRVSVEFPPGHAPTIVLINGHPAPLHIIQPSAGSGETSGFATAQVGESTLGFEAPSLFVASRTPHKADNTTLWSLPGDESAIPAWVSAASDVTPFLQQWLGPAPRSQLNILDLPDPDDATFETGPLLVTAIVQAAPNQLTGIFAHALAHAWMSSPRAWLDEGVAHFMGTLWLEKQSGRQKALEALASGRAPLALVEPSSPGESSGQPLAQAFSPVYYRTKATYIFWMLRDLVGDPALSAALRAYNPAADTAGDSGSAYFEKLVEQAAASSSTSSSLVPQVSLPNRDLAWFFSDWMNNDKGLPDISIDSVFPASAAGPPPPLPHSTKAAKSAPDLPSASDTVAPPSANTWIVTVNLSNSGYAAAEIPVTVSNAQGSITQSVLVPARGSASKRILFQGMPTRVQANDGTVPETEAGIHILTLTGDSSGSSSSR